jgi:acetyl-CoA carboxylase carboxyltransferase component
MSHSVYIHYSTSVKCHLEISYYSTAKIWDDGIIDRVDTRKNIGPCISASLNHPTEDAKYGIF